MLSGFCQRKRLANQVLSILDKHLSDAKCELIYNTPFQLLMSVMLSAQTTDKMVNKCCSELYHHKIVCTPIDIVKLGQSRVYDLIKSIGLAPTKSKNLVHLSQILIEKYNSKVPESREDLESLPGVGTKTASVVLGELFNHKVLAVDTHVLRVTKRLALHNDLDPKKVENILVKLIDRGYLPRAHHLFIHHGRYTCTARKPRCDQCVVNDICQFSTNLNR